MTEDGFSLIGASTKGRRVQGKCQAASSFPESLSSAVCGDKGTFLLYLVNNNPLGSIKPHKPTLIPAHRVSVPTPAIKQH